jgi:stearoyl-CoA desaturase (delta-9 desaturase)
MHLAKRWLHRDSDRIPLVVQERVATVCAQNDVLSKLVSMREELRQLWTRTNVSADQLVVDLQAWCKKAEDSGIIALQEFALKLRAAHA